MNYKIIENKLLPIYENDKNEKLVNARELHLKLGSKQEFANWIKNRIKKYNFIENEDFIRFDKFIKGDEKGFGNKTIIEYYLTIDTAKEIAMVENNEIGRKIRRYFIELEKRYRTIVENPKNIFDFLRLALNQIETNEKEINKVKLISEKNSEQIEEIKSKMDIKIKNDYCLASDIAEQLKIYSENGLPHSNFIGAIARKLGYKISYKHYYEDEYIAIVQDNSKGNEFWQVYYKRNAVEKIINWFNKNKQKIEYKIVYQKNSKKGLKGEIKERGFKIEDICYKVICKDNC